MIGNNNNDKHRVNNEILNKLRKRLHKCFFFFFNMILNLTSLSINFIIASS